MVAAFALIIAIFNLVSMLTGTPRACASAEKSIRKFYEGALTETGFVAKIFGKAKNSPDCLSYLVPEAVVSIGGWPGFQEHWSQVNADVIAAAKKDSPAALSRFEFKYEATIGHLVFVGRLRVPAQGQPNPCLLRFSRYVV
jgi:hypothetical protein